MDINERGLAIAMVRETKEDVMRVAERLNDPVMVARFSLDPDLAVDVRTLASSLDTFGAVLLALLAPCEKTEAAGNLQAESAPAIGLSRVSSEG